MVFTGDGQALDALDTLHAGKQWVVLGIPNHAPSQRTAEMGKRIGLLPNHDCKGIGIWV